MDLSLKPSDYESIIEFASIIATPNENIRSIILQELAERFGYTKSIFWVADNEGNLSDPVFHGLDEKAIHRYMDQFYKYDLLHPHTVTLTEREKDVVALVKEGKTNKEIAEELFISHNTVKKHLQNIYQKYGVTNKIQLVQKV